MNLILRADGSQPQMEIGMACRYFGNTAEAERRLPFDAGFEAVGVVAAVGPEVEGEDRINLGPNCILHDACARQLDVFQKL